MRLEHHRESLLRSPVATSQRAAHDRPPSVRYARSSLGNQAMQRLLMGTAQNTPDLQRQNAAPSYRDCTQNITGISDANEKLEAARIRARDFVDVAIAALGKTPASGSSAATALARHFINPTATQRETIRENYRQILHALHVTNFICNTAGMCGQFQAFWLPDDDLLHVCPRFWRLDRTCQAIVLIHEAAHDIGVDAGLTGHPMNRGTATYPAGNDPPPDGETAANRIVNPDAYGFYGAHIWRETDTGSRCGDR